MCLSICCFFFKQKTAYEMRISDWSSDACSSDLAHSTFIQPPASDWTPRFAGAPTSFSAQPAHIVSTERPWLGSARSCGLSPPTLSVMTIQTLRHAAQLGSRFSIPPRCWPIRWPTRRCCSFLARLGEPLTASGLYAAAPGRAGLLPSAMARRYPASPPGYWASPCPHTALASLPPHSRCRILPRTTPPSPPPSTPPPRL